MPSAANQRTVPVYSVSSTAVVAGVAASTGAVTFAVSASAVTTVGVVGAGVPPPPP